MRLIVLICVLLLLLQITKEKKTRTILWPYVLTLLLEKEVLISYFGYTTYLARTQRISGDA